MGTMRALVFLATLVGVFQGDGALRILVSFPMPAPSHNILGQGVARHLLEAGHEVVYITSLPRNTTIPGLREYDVSSMGSEFLKTMSKGDAFKLKNLVGKSNIGDNIPFMYFVSGFHNTLVENEKFQEFLSCPEEKFDAVILEWFFSEVTVGIPALFQCPLIWVGTTEAHGNILRVIDEVPSPAYNADLFSTRVPPFSFVERLIELWTTIKRQFVVNFLISPSEKSVYDTIYPKIAAKRNVKLPSFEEAVFNGSMMFLNSHPSVGTPFRLPPNVKYIGGYHVDSDVKPLPKDLQKLMDESKHGVIYFSMGSNLKSADMTKEMKDGMLKLFGTLKEDVIWKFEDNLDNVPSNVHLVKWAPQQSILAHANLKIFITHGGQLSTTEAIHFGVPVIGIPVLGDQFVNMKSVESKGFGILVTLAEDMASPIEKAVNEMLKNPEYRRKAKSLSSIYHDRPTTPGKELVHWVEHVVKTGGAPHLRSSALLLSWYQKMYLDAVCLVILLGVLACWGLKLCRRSKNVQSKKNKDKVKVK